MPKYRSAEFHPASELSHGTSRASKMAPSPPPAAPQGVAHSAPELWNFPESDRDPGDAK